MAWMRMMGADSVDYHRSTVLARGDDHPGQALAHYASRGETPLLWGGLGAKALGLQGAVTDAQYGASFGPDGACDPTTGERLVNTKRPGLELVVSAHKSVAELGVIGRAKDMHSGESVAPRAARLGTSPFLAPPSTPSTTGLRSVSSPDSDAAPSRRGEPTRCSCVPMEHPFRPRPSTGLYEGLLTGPAWSCLKGRPPMPFATTTADPRTTAIYITVAATQLIAALDDAGLLE